MIRRVTVATVGALQLVGHCWSYGAPNAVPLSPKTDELAAADCGAVVQTIGLDSERDPGVVLVHDYHLESEYLLSQYKFTRKFVLRCTVGDRINNRLIF